MQITQDKVVQIEYTLTNAEGEVIDASEGHPLAYLHGHGNLIPGLEKQLEGKSVRDKFKAEVPAVEAYGEINPALIQQVPREMFQGVETIEAGMRFEGQDENGNVQAVIIRDADEEFVTVDANHELAGHDLTFDIEIISIRDADEEELDHGHAH